ncbi:MAG: NAD(P)H-dependent oxidoreductase subunit E [Dehalococcoidales bacterium]|nr:NAD(P)H-dependent oxidoreductase subunit E [Dehalococcoidales bacterium]
MAIQTLDKIFQGRRSQPNQLIEVLQDIQKEQGYISQEAMQTVSVELGVPVMEVYRVASFYTAFRLKPPGKYILTMCTGTACHVRGSDLLIDHATDQLGIQPGEVTPDGLFSIECVNCLGACALGPIVTENGTYHHHMTPGRLRKLIEALRNRETEDNGNA